MLTANNDNPTPARWQNFHKTHNFSRWHMRFNEQKWRKLFAFFKWYGYDMHGIFMSIDFSNAIGLIRLFALKFKWNASESMNKKILWYAMGHMDHWNWRHYFSAVVEMKFQRDNQQRPISFDIISIGTNARKIQKNSYFGGHNRAQWAIDRMPTTLAETVYFYERKEARYSERKGKACWKNIAYLKNHKTDTIQMNFHCTLAFGWCQFRWKECGFR